MAIEKVKEYFSKYGIADRVQEFDVSSATVDLAAQALGCEPCRIAKTLSFLVDGHAILIVAAGDAKIDNPKYKAQFGTKAKMLTEASASIVAYKTEPASRRTTLPGNAASIPMAARATAPAAIAASNALQRKSTSVREASSAENSTSPQRLRA